MPSDLAVTEAEEWECRKQEIINARGLMLKVSGEQLRVILLNIRLIREKKLYRHGEYKTFREFCEKLVNTTRQRVEQLLGELDIREALGSEKSKLFALLPGAALAELKDTTPAAAVEIVQQAASEHPKKRVTAAGIKRVRARVIDATGEPEEEHRCPCCGQAVKRDAVLVPWPKEAER